MRFDRVVVAEGPVFAISGNSGNMQRHSHDGFYALDTRFLSLFHVTFQHRELEPVGADSLEHWLATFYASSHGTKEMPAGAIRIVRDRYVSQVGMHEDIALINHSLEERRVHIDVAFDADFADIFEVRQDRVRKAGRLSIGEREGQDIALVYEQGAFHRETWISFSKRPVVQERTATFEITLAPRETWKTCVNVRHVLDGQAPVDMQCVDNILGHPFGAYRPSKESGRTFKRVEDLPLEGLPLLRTTYPGLGEVFDQAVADLRSLRMEYLPGQHILAAGLPWFMAVFGRDSIISAIQTKLLSPDLLTGTLHTLASLQANSEDEFREAEPGKIPHEVRAGELSVLERVPHSRYYGSVDSTPLFLVLLWEAYQWTGDQSLVERMQGHAEGALDWIDRYGDRDHDGFIEHKAYARAGRTFALRNQGWKDSGDSISFADGRLAEGPLSLAEVQGYVYDAKVKMADLYRVLNEVEKAERLEHQAAKLRQTFLDAFWMPEEGFFAVALDGKKRQVNSITSNPGHLLWSGILDQDKAALVVERLLSPEMYSGWGVRTLATDMGRYDPLSYHNGSVWPHDNSLIAAGMARYGFIDQATTIAHGLFDAGHLFEDHRPPELFAGFPRRERSFPVPYQDANAPQAWASGAIVYLIESLLGVVPSGNRLMREATQEGPSVSLRGVLYRGTRRVL